jgi:IS5 family transposase
MLKLVLLGQWNSLSDEELEYSLRVRLDFIAFCGFDINDDVPDETTICRFRNKLIEKDLINAILTEVNN